jgi:hypothetical protein
LHICRIGSLAIALALAAGIVLWHWLPLWAPTWTVRHSPWDGPALRALAAGEPDLIYAHVDSWGPDRSIALVIAGLGHRDPRIRARCAGIAGTTEQIDTRGSPAAGLVEAFHPYLLRLIDDQDPSVRLTAAQVIVHFGHVEARAALERHLDDTDPAVRRACAASLARLRLP